MSDDRDKLSDIENMGPGDVPEPGPDEPELLTDEDVPEATDSDDVPKPDSDEEHGFKHSTRETVGKAVGFAVQVGSILGGQGGDIVEAERTVAEAETEELIDRVDGEG